LWIVEGQQPSGSDVLGASVAIAGALIIVGFDARA
jgi:drug/metabolite transporter superfamily protein YnfA